MIAGAIFIASALLMLALAITAPEGFEDADGFHRGRPDDATSPSSEAA